MVREKVVNLRGLTFVLLWMGSTEMRTVAGVVVTSLSCPKNPEIDVCAVPLLF